MTEKLSAVTDDAKTKTKKQKCVAYSNTYATFEQSIEEGISTMNGEYVGYGW